MNSLLISLNMVEFSKYYSQINNTQVYGNETHSLTARILRVCYNLNIISEGMTYLKWVNLKVYNTYLR